MVSRENIVIGVCVLAALPASYAVDAVTGSYPAGLATLFAVGIVLPAVVTRLLSERRLSE
jgi:hypothetical protein